MKIVHFYEFVKVHRQHLEGKNKVLAKNESLDNSDYIFLIFRIVGFQLFQDTGFNQPLFVQPLFISEDLQGDNFLLFVIEAFEYLAEGARSVREHMHISID